MAFVVAEPTATPFKVNVIVLPLTPFPPDSSVALTTAVVPYVPFAAAAREDGSNPSRGWLRTRAVFDDDGVQQEEGRSPWWLDPR